MGFIVTTLQPSVQLAVHWILHGSITILEVSQPGGNFTTDEQSSSLTFLELDAFSARGLTCFFVI